MYSDCIWFSLVKATKRSPRSRDFIFTNGCKECSGSVGRVLDWRSKGCLFESQDVVSLGKTFYPLLCNLGRQQIVQHDLILFIGT